MSTESRLALAFALSAALPTVLPAVVWAQDQAAGDSASVTSDGNGDVAPSLDSTSLDSTDASSPADVTQVPEAAATADSVEPEPYPNTVAVGDDAPTPVAVDNALPSSTRLHGQMVVTAQKREENIPKVPLPITAFSADSPDAKGLTQQ